jgi:hypothetical protein
MQLGTLVPNCWPKASLEEREDVSKALKDECISRETGYWAVDTSLTSKEDLRTEPLSQFCGPIISLRRIPWPHAQDACGWHTKNLIALTETSYGAEGDST